MPAAGPLQNGRVRSIRPHGYHPAPMSFSPCKAAFFPGSNFISAQIHDKHHMKAYYVMEVDNPRPCRVYTSLADARACETYDRTQHPTLTRYSNSEDLAEGLYDFCWRRHAHPSPDPHALPGYYLPSGDVMSRKDIIEDHHLATSVSPSEAASISSPGPPPANAANFTLEIPQTRQHHPVSHTPSQSDDTQGRVWIVDSRGYVFTDPLEAEAAARDHHVKIRMVKSLHEAREWYLAQVQA